MIEILPGFADNVLAIAAHGRLTSEDFSQVLRPAVEEKMRLHKPLRFLARLGSDYDGIAPGAIMEDARLGLSHWKDWGAIAVVTDSAAVREMAGFFALFFHHPMRVFFDADYDLARAWIGQDSPGPED